MRKIYLNIFLQSILSNLFTITYSSFIFYL
nr:MAG TPA: hypothetical protein [Caudoviricetes sp.]